MQNDRNSQTAKKVGWVFTPDAGSVSLRMERPCGQRFALHAPESYTFLSHPRPKGRKSKSCHGGCRVYKPQQLEAEAEVSVEHRSLG